MSEEAKYEGSITYRVSSGRWGTKTTIAERIVSVGTSPTKIVSNNPRRLGFLITNNGIYPVRIAFSEDNVLNGGIVLSAQGGTITMGVEDDGEIVGYDVYAICPGGTSDIYVMEVVAI